MKIVKKETKQEETSRGFKNLWDVLEVASNGDNSTW